MSPRNKREMTYGMLHGHLGHTLNKYGTLVKTFCIEIFFQFFNQRIAFKPSTQAS